MLNCPSSCRVPGWLREHSNPEPVGRGPCPSTPRFLCWAARPMELPVLCPLPRSSREADAQGQGPVTRRQLGGQPGCWPWAPGLLWGPMSPRCELSPERRVPPSTHWPLERPSHSHGHLPFAPPRSLCPPALQGGRWGPQASSPGLRVQAVLSGPAAISPGCPRRAGGPGGGTRPRHTALMGALWLHFPTPPGAPQVAGVPCSGPPSSLRLSCTQPMARCL